MKYVCPVCGYVYDEAKEGVPWADLPESWVCPICGMPKSAFAAQEPEAERAAPAVGEDNAEMPEGERALSAAELAAICSNLARGCEKQYMDEERALFSRLAEHYSSLVPPAEGSDGELIKLIGDACDGQFAAAKAEAEAAGDRGAQRAIVWGERVNFVLKSLISRYQDGGEAALRDAKIWVCTICGFIFVGDEPPEICPVCKVPSFKFVAGGQVQ